MKHTLTIEGTPDEIRATLDAIAGRTDTSTTTPASTPAVEPTVAPTDDVKSDADVTTDAIGMPYDESIHASPPSFKSNGSWKVKKGQADNARAAIAAFKAAGGNVTPPVIEDETVKAATGGMPGVTETTSMPSAETPAPVDLDTVMGKWTELLGNGKLTKEKGTEISVRAAASDTGAEPYSVFRDDPAARVRLMAELTAIEAG